MAKMANAVVRGDRKDVKNPAISLGIVSAAGAGLYFLLRELKKEEPLSEIPPEQLPPDIGEIGEVINDILQDIQDLEQQLAQLQQSIENMQRLIDEQARLIEEAKGAIAELQARIAQSKALLESMQQDVNNLESIINQLEQERASLESRLGNTTPELQRMQALLQQAAQEVQRLKTQLEEAIRLNQELQNTVQTLLSIISQLEQNNTALQAEIDKMKQTVANMEITIGQLKSDISKLQYMLEPVPVEATLRSSGRTGSSLGFTLSLAQTISVQGSLTASANYPWVHLQNCCCQVNLYIKDRNGNTLKGYGTYKCRSVISSWGGGAVSINDNINLPIGSYSAQVVVLTSGCGGSATWDVTIKYKTARFLVK